MICLLKNEKSNAFIMVLQGLERNGKEITQFKSISEQLKVYKHKYCFTYYFQTIHRLGDSFELKDCQDKEIAEST